jgi:cytochrome c553
MKRSTTMKHHRIAFLVLSGLVLMAAAPGGKTIAFNGNGHGATSCAACHGDHFQGGTAIHAPALAGLSASFILARLAHYKGPAGHNAMMKTEANALTPGESDAVAAYLASQPKA